MRVRQDFISHKIYRNNFVLIADLPISTRCRDDSTVLCLSDLIHSDITTPKASVCKLYCYSPGLPSPILDDCLYSPSLLLDFVSDIIRAEMLQTWIIQRITKCFCKRTSSSAITERLQLSQRDCAAGWVNGQKWKTGTGRQYLRILQFYLQPLWCNWLAKQSNSVKKTQNKGYYDVQGHSRSSKPVCDFLLVINSNWHHISYRFGVITAILVKFWTICVFEPPWGR